jgi:hypothetical protein
LREKVCAAGPAGGDGIDPAHRGVGLGEALGTRSGLPGESTGGGRGTFDTLTGNPLVR